MDGPDSRMEAPARDVEADRQEEQRRHRVRRPQPTRRRRMPIHPLVRAEDQERRGHDGEDREVPVRLETQPEEGQEGEEVRPAAAVVAPVRRQHDAARDGQQGGQDEQDPRDLRVPDRKQLEDVARRDPVVSARADHAELADREQGSVQAVGIRQGRQHHQQVDRRQAPQRSGLARTQAPQPLRRQVDRAQGDAQREQAVHVHPHDLDRDDRVAPGVAAPLVALEERQDRGQQDEGEHLGPRQESRAGDQEHETEAQRRDPWALAAPADGDQDRDEAGREKGLGDDDPRVSGQGVDPRQAKLEQPVRIDVAGAGGRVGEHVDQRDAAHLRDPVARAQVPPVVGAVELLQAGARREQEQQCDECSRRQALARFGLHDDRAPRPCRWPPTLPEVPRPLSTAPGLQPSPRGVPPTRARAAASRDPVRGRRARDTPCRFRTRWARSRRLR